MNRIMIAGTGSGCGKTTITCGILQGLIGLGYKVGAFKCGPDYIDPMFHSKVLGAKTGNLDSFFTEPKDLRELLYENSKELDITVIEGVMGYYDGIGFTDIASSYSIAEITDTPVILIINCKGMSNSIGAVLKGYLSYKDNSRIKGVIFNQLPESLYEGAKLLANKAGIKALGYVPKLKVFNIESRHLGLVTADEIHNIKNKIEHISSILLKTVNFTEIIKLAGETSEIKSAGEASVIKSAGEASVIKSVGEASEIESVEEKEKSIDNNFNHRQIIKNTVNLAIAQDEAFCFHYRDNLTLLKKLGCNLIPFSPIRDCSLPREADGLILVGGYPELYADVLSENHTMIASIKTAIEQGMPTIAECGGFLYLHEYLEDINNNESNINESNINESNINESNINANVLSDIKNDTSISTKKHEYPMVGIIKGKAYKTSGLKRFGYLYLEAKKDNLLLKQGEKIRAHEFHYFDSEKPGNDFIGVKASNNKVWDCVFATDTLYAGFPHLYLNQNIPMAERFVYKCFEWKQSFKRSYP